MEARCDVRRVFAMPLLQNVAGKTVRLTDGNLEQSINIFLRGTVSSDYLPHSTHSRKPGPVNISRPSKSLPWQRRISGKPSQLGLPPRAYRGSHHFHNLLQPDHRYNRKGIPISAYFSPSKYDFYKNPISMIIGTIHDVKGDKS
jgi:hypothetical protein